MKQTVIIVTLFFSFIGSCTFVPSRLEQTLQMAGENRVELEHVLSHYDSIGDAEKRKAAEFLIENMIGLGQYEGRVLDKFYAHLDTTYKYCNSNFENIKAFYDSTLKETDWKSLRFKSDLKNIKSEYLINNIDQAFEVRQSPFLREMSFDDFCEFILPYRISNEVLEDWRSEYRAYYSFVFDSLDFSRDSVMDDLCAALTKRYTSHNYMYPNDMPSLKPSFLKRSMIAPCSDFTKMTTFFARANGIPIVRDFIVQWANYPHGHEWNAVLWHGKSINLMIGEHNELGGHLRKCSNIYTKIYRHTFSLQPPKEVEPAYSEIEVPTSFQNPRMRDVTTEYLPTIDVEIKNLHTIETEEKYVYLTVFDNKNWNAIAWAKVEGKKAIFKNIGVRNAIYLPAYYHNGQYIPAQNPICLGEDSTITYLQPDTTNYETVVLTRKYYETRMKLFLRWFCGGRIQLSTNSNFSDTISFVIPDTISSNYQTWNIEGKWRYVRYLPNEKYDCGIAELEAYDKNGQKIEAKVIGNNQSKNPYSQKNICDGNVLSYTTLKKTQKGVWVGLDFGRPTDISRIDYLSRNDANFIVEGHEYELMYWDGEWRSLGKQVGSRQTQQLVFERVPRHALLLLHNHTRGKEERIFTYDNGQQVWW